MQAGRRLPYLVRPGHKLASWSHDREQNRSFVDRLPFPYQNRFDLARGGGLDGHLHLHRLEKHKRVSLLYLVSGLDFNASDPPF